MGYTQYEFARMLTLKQSHYNKIENGLIEPSFGILQLICIYLEIDLTELLELKKPKLLNNSSLNLLSLNSSKFKSSNLNLLGNLYIEKFLLSIYDKKIDIIVLTANPLYLYPSNDHPKELRTLNDFNSITDSIYQAVSKCSIPVVSQFLTLTKDTLKYAISKKPRILHLICKSTYERYSIPKNKGYYFLPFLNGLG